MKCTQFICQVLVVVQILSCGFELQIWKHFRGSGGSPDPEASECPSGSAAQSLQQRYPDWTSSIADPDSTDIHLLMDLAVTSRGMTGCYCCFLDRWKPAGLWSTIRPDWITHVAWVCIAESKQGSAGMADISNKAMTGMIGSSYSLLTKSVPSSTNRELQARCC